MELEGKWTPWGCNTCTDHSASLCIAAGLGWGKFAALLCVLGDLGGEMARQLEPACSHSSQTCYGATAQSWKGLKRAECKCALQAGTQSAKNGSDNTKNVWVQENIRIFLQIFCRPAPPGNWGETWKSRCENTCRRLALKSEVFCHIALPSLMPRYGAVMNNWVCRAVKAAAAAEGALCAF